MTQIEISASEVIFLVNFFDNLQNIAQILAVLRPVREVSHMVVSPGCVPFITRIPDESARIAPPSPLLSIPRLLPHRQDAPASEGGPSRIVKIRGTGSIRAKLYGSVLYAMLSRQVFRIAIGLATQLPNKSMPESTIIHLRAIAYGRGEIEGTRRPSQHV